MKILVVRQGNVGIQWQKEVFVEVCLLKANGKHKYVMFCLLLSLQAEVQMEGEMKRCLVAKCLKVY
jgi:dephospho-CoA kinase